ncbi:D-alanine---D-alanine ligase [Apiospora saccharicola]
MSVTSSSILGRVDSISPHVKPDWWASSFQETYLRTDGDVVENPSITESECVAILNHPLVKALSQSKGKEGTSGVTPLRLLDLCCGQGRHTIYLAQQLPDAQFHGHDQSSFLVDLARGRARTAGFDDNVTFTTGRADHVPAESGSLDIVILMGNSLGYGDKTDDVKTLQEVYRVLKPGGVFLLDLPEADELVDSVKDRSWEWIDGRETAALLANDSSLSPIHGVNDRKLLACRERELSVEKDKLVARELVIDMEKGVVEDMFYSVNLYKIEDMVDLLERCGLAVNVNAGDSTNQARHHRIGRPESNRDEELGMMEYRNMIVSQRPDFGTNWGVSLLALPMAADWMYLPTHPHKGTTVCTTTHIRAGTLLIVDTPYACVPSIDPAPGDWVPCSRPECNRRIPRGSIVGNAKDNEESGEAERAFHCHCHAEVAWCDADCRALDEKRHSLECSWLAAHADEILKQHGTYIFNMLWLVARILARRWVELTGSDPEGKAGQDTPKSPIETESTARKDVEAPLGDNTWATVEHTLLSNRDKVHPQRMEYWSTLASTYLASQPFSISTSGSASSAALDLDVPSIVDLICKEETNSFALYPKPTGVFPVPASEGGIDNGHSGAKSHQGKPGRGTPYGDSTPVMHGPDSDSRMLMYATRDILPGEECCIAYFDLEERRSLEARQELLDRYFLFTCDCGRCTRERASASAASM